MTPRRRPRSRRARSAGPASWMHVVDERRQERARHPGVQSKPRAAPLDELRGVDHPRAPSTRGEHPVRVREVARRAEHVETSSVEPVAVTYSTAIGSPRSTRASSRDGMSGASKSGRAPDPPDPAAAPPAPRRSADRSSARAPACGCSLNPLEQHWRSTVARSSGRSSTRSPARCWCAPAPRRVDDDDEVGVGSRGRAGCSCGKAGRRTKISSVCSARPRRRGTRARWSRRSAG